MPARLSHVLLRLEGLAVGAAAVALYFHEDFGWILFVALILAPDLSFAAYVFGPKVGAVAYDAVHTEIFPIALGTAGGGGGSCGATEGGVVWAPPPRAGPPLGVRRQ